MKAAAVLCTKVRLLPVAGLGFALALGSAGCGEASTSAGSKADAGRDAASDANADATTPDAGGGHFFSRSVLHTEFYGEGAHASDVDRDGELDVIAGPFWYAGPDFVVRHTIYPPRAYDPKRYSDNFFVFPYDINGDDWVDVLVVGFPGEGARWYENPRGSDSQWVRHEAFAQVDTESPTFLDLTGDGRPELVCANQGRLGYASPDWANPSELWTFHPLSAPGAFQAFTHGLGVGDANSDGRLDVLEANGYWEQPASLSGDPLWNFVANPFGNGGAQMFAVDLDGDSDADVVASLAAHGYGLAWFERTPGGYTQHLLAGAAPGDAPGDVVFHEPHALAVGDLDGDGLVDVVGGERFWGHVPEGDPNFGDPAQLYWFQQRRAGGKTSFVPHLIDAASGVGTQVEIVDVDGNGLGDVVVASKKGAFVFRHFRDSL